MDFLKKNFAIVLAFTLPILLIIIVSLSIYLPSLFISTDYNFVYIACTNGVDYYPYNCDKYLQRRYLVIDDKLVVKEMDPVLDLNNDKMPDTDENYNARIFLHDTVKNESREISLKEAQALTLSNLLTSPDGVTVSSRYDRNNSGVFSIFGGNYSDYGYYLTKGRSRSKINLINSNDRYYYRNNFQFIGWVLPGRN